MFKKRGHLAIVCRSKGAQGTAASLHSNDGKQLQQTQALESETCSPAGEQEAYTLFPVKSQRANPIEVWVTTDGVMMMMELNTGIAVSDISEHTSYPST